MLVYLMVLHFIADFLLQSREMGKKKSSELSWLLKHLSIQAGVFFCGLMLLSSSSLQWFQVMQWIELVVLNTLIHGVIDWNIWKAYKASAYFRIKKNPQHELITQDKINPWKYWEDHWFYSTIGFDQLLHASTIVLLYKVLICV